MINPSKRQAHESAYGSKTDESNFFELQNLSLSVSRNECAEHMIDFSFQELIQRF